MYFRHCLSLLSLILTGASEEINTCDFKVLCDGNDTKNCYYKLNNYKSRDTLLEFPHSTKDYLSENYDYPPILPIYDDKVKKYSNKLQHYHKLLEKGRDTQTLLVEPQNYETILKFYVHAYPNGDHYKLNRTRDDLQLQLCKHEQNCQDLKPDQPTKKVLYNKVFCTNTCLEIKSLIISWNYNANKLTFTVQENNKKRQKFVLTDKLAHSPATEGIFEFFDKRVLKTETIIKDAIFQKRIHSREDHLAISNSFSLEENESIFFDFYVPPKFPTIITLLCPDLKDNTNVKLTNTDKDHYWQQVMLPAKEHKAYKNCVVQIENKANVFWKIMHFSSVQQSDFIAKIFNRLQEIRVKRLTEKKDEKNCEVIKCNKKETHQVMYKDYCNLNEGFGLKGYIGLCEKNNFCSLVPDKKPIENITVCMVDSNSIDAIIVKWCAKSIKAYKNKEKIYGFTIKVNYNNKNVFEKNKSIPYAINEEIKCYTDILTVHKTLVQELEISSIFHETKSFNGNILDQKACMATTD